MSKGEISASLFFDYAFSKEKNIKLTKPVYTKNKSKAKLASIVKDLTERALDENIKFQKRKLPSSFNPVFNCYLLFSDFKFKDTDTEIDDLIKFGDLFFENIESKFGIKAVDYSLVYMDLDGDGGVDGFFPGLFYFELFNYDFIGHKALKTNFAKPESVDAFCRFAEEIFLKSSLQGSRKNDKSNDFEREDAKCYGSDIKSRPAVEEIRKEINGAVKDTLVKDTLVKDTLVKDTLIDTKEESINDRLKIISMSWSSLSPSRNDPILEAGEPEEMYGKSLLRIYFQKPNVRYIVWRFRDKPVLSLSGVKLIMRVYVDDKMLWYEHIESISGSKYIFLSEDIELHRTWAEIGYLSETGQFVFTARTPVWPPPCMFKVLPKSKRTKNSKMISQRVQALLGGTENIRTGGNQLPVSHGSGGNFFGSGSNIN